MQKLMTTKQLAVYTICNNTQTALERLNLFSGLDESAPVCSGQNITIRHYKEIQVKTNVKRVEMLSQAISGHQIDR